MPPKAKQSQLLLLKKHQRLLTQLRSNQEDEEYEDCDCYETEVDFHRSYAQPTLQDEDDEEELSDYVKFRLFLARQRALEAYARTYKTA